MYVCEDSSLCVCSHFDVSVILCVCLRKYGSERGPSTHSSGTSTDTTRKVRASVSEREGWWVMTVIGERVSECE